MAAACNSSVLLGVSYVAFNPTIKIILKGFPLQHTPRAIVLEDNFAGIEESSQQGSASLGACSCLLQDRLTGHYNPLFVDLCLVLAEIILSGLSIHTEHCPRK